MWINNPVSGYSNTPALPGQPPPWHNPHQQLHGKPQHELSRSCGSRTTTAAISASAAATSISTTAVSAAAAAALPAAGASCYGPAASLSAASWLPHNARVCPSNGRSIYVRQHGDARVFLSAGENLKSVICVFWVMIFVLRREMGHALRFLKWVILVPSFPFYIRLAWEVE